MLTFHPVDGTTCPECGGTLGYGIKDEAGGWKAFCDCLDCGTEFGCRRITMNDINHRDEVSEHAREHVRSCSA